MVHVGKIYHTWILWVRTMVGPTNYLVQVIATSHEFSPQIGGLVREMGPLISGTPRLVNKKLTSPVMPLKVESVLFSFWVVLFCHISLVVPVFPCEWPPIHQPRNGY